MNSLLDSFDIAASSLIAQSELKRINIKNLAYSESLIKKNNGSYEPYTPETAIVKFLPINKNEKNIGGIYIEKIIQKKKPINFIYQPNNVLANKKGYIPNNNTTPLNETIKNIDISLQYKMSVEILKTIKNLILKTLSLYEN
ncbi:hypothetical protein [Buchnera aphidicola]|uniref:Flagellar basal-body rod protein FlgC n=1 Tax=Buchnera aphidicola subsp. Tuberolachnus salignus TaxID=98804 RepID=A0A160SX16_BUCTT|nr:hypothetical protein [Buchnera aphidicola]CUR53198.1 Flagellar basal-body rod protein FlgC [Buchnera aphidicola (Tuberolachnus salignus)]